LYFNEVVLDRAALKLLTRNPSFAKHEPNNPAPMVELTCGQECQQKAKLLSSFLGSSNSAIPSNYISSAMGIAVFQGDLGVACVRLPSQDWFV
jgi:hypothetical protein